MYAAKESGKKNNEMRSCSLKVEKRLHLQKHISPTTCLLRPFFLGNFWKSGKGMVLQQHLVPNEHLEAPEVGGLHYRHPCEDSCLEAETVV